ncbi:ATP-binding protein [Agromyces archimandritae]|uniref:ATP-dependent exonuclease SbcCD, C subunit-like protein n=1 Tax=Agromyces archimandritae TaxID=2781962 RepID=A0A975INU8_9MICO|nr:ATP-binding protein [Agromyces archimandritae]QTX04957.1 hypothetical protein G127AT_01505 [Agromyces archimandritae]
MTDTLFSALEVDDGASRRTGYRLRRVEVLNWGTFDGQVWTITPDGSTSLLTGDIGSGKSTLVDAISTLLLPAHRIAYNKAAGADSKERTLRSYVEGHYRSERNETTGASRPVGLRDHRSYSVILGVFGNDGFDETVSVAQVFHQQDRAGQPDRFFVTAAHELTIAGDFSDFGSDLKALRAKLRGTGADLDTTFPEYQRKMRRLLGIRSEQAMELFHQTVSMKSVGNLNDFVRDHMLEPADAAAKIEGVVAHFDDLVASHESVRRAGQQLELLGPLIAAADRFDDAAARHGEHLLDRDSVVPYVSERLVDLLTSAIDEETAALDELDVRRSESVAAREALVPERTRLTLARVGVGGDRLRELERDIPRAADLHDERVERRRIFALRLTDAGLAPVETGEEFRERRADAARAEDDAAAAAASLKQRRDPLFEQRAELRRGRKSLADERDGLELRRNNLPAELDAVRRRMTEALGLDGDDLPFAGELLDVADAHAGWRGAAERVLRGFALTMLVADEHYGAVSQWVNDHRLDAHLVYLRVPERRIRTIETDTGAGLRLRDILEVESGRFTDYLRSELARRADHRLVDSVAELRREDRAVTREGLVRDRDRHEKDDRRASTGPRAWVLGRGSEAKIAALDAAIAEFEHDLDQVEAALTALDQEDDRLRALQQALAALAAYSAWAEVDSAAAEQTLHALERERDALVAGSSELAEIDRQLEALERRDAELGIEFERIIGQRSAVEVGRTSHERRLEQERATLALLGDVVLARARERGSALDARTAGAALRTVEECDALRQRLVADLTAAVEQAQKEMNGYTTSIQSQMGEVLRTWPVLRTDLDASIQSIGAFREFHARVLRDDLPRFEAEFRTQLNTNAVGELAQFSSWLRRQAEEIHARVDRINEALAAIDYNPGRIIVLMAEPTVNQEVRQFRADLREATTDVLDGSDLDLEARFEQVRAIVERLKGRVGHADADRAWTKRVTDVRVWFTFAASEQDRQTHAEFEHYTDSDGKSGGQKEKLAYTILAASLAYQFGLEWGVSKSRDFRFAVIDEAFGRGSDASTRYALELFAKLGLQLLVVTPLQKVHIIEPYVDSIGFVDNPTGSASRVRSLTIEEYRQRQSAPVSA